MLEHVSLSDAGSSASLSDAGSLVSLLDAGHGSSFVGIDTLTKLLIMESATTSQSTTALRCFHKTSLDRLEGFTPATSDWHARLCLVTVSL